MDKTIIRIPTLSGDLSDLLNNPDRGFRLEVALDVKLNRHPFFREFEGTTSYLKHQYNYYKEDKPKLVQTYFYLSQFEDSEINENAFKIMDEFFEALREMKLKALLRFAYETDFEGPKGARQGMILNHMKQLAPLIEKNKDVIHVYQAGFIGAWGEWHASKYPLDKKAILEGILEMVPEDMQVQIRLPDYKNLIGCEHPKYNKIGFHDDFIVNKQHEWDGGLDFDSRQFNQIVDECPTLLVDGELPWGSWSVEEDGWLIDGLLTIKRLAMHRYTSLSVVHNYKEKGEDLEFSMCKWKNEVICEKWLEENNLHYSVGFFEDEKGKKVQRSIFDYIKYHLGYYLEIDSLEINKVINPSEKVNISLKLFNHGFAAPLGLTKSELVIINSEGEIVSSSSVGECKKWHPHDEGFRQLPHKIEGELVAPKEQGSYEIGFRMSNSTNEFVRLANNVQFKDGINVLFGFNID